MELPVDPLEVKEIKEKKAALGGKLQHVFLKVLSVRVGSYRSTPGDHGYVVAAMITELGIALAIPHASYKNKLVQIYIPKAAIVEALVCNERRAGVIIIKTGPDYAKWIREALGFDGTPDNDTSNYYCPINGSRCQRRIAILSEKLFTPADFGCIKTLLDVREILAHPSTMKKILMQMIPQPSSPEKSPTPSFSSPTSGVPTIVDPIEVFREIEEKKAAFGGKFQYLLVKVRSVRVGSHRSTPGDNGYVVAAMITELGIAFRIPHASYRHKLVQICIPKAVIVEALVCNRNRLGVIFITTGPNYAKWIREALGFDGTPDNDTSNYYCPINGSRCQRRIAILFDELFTPADFGCIKTLLDAREINYTRANEILMQMTPQPYKSSISYQNQNDGSSSSPEKSPTPAVSSPSSGVPNIVSTRSLGQPGATASSSTPQKTGEEKEKQSQSGSATPAVSSTSTVLDPDSEMKAVLFFEGINKC